MAELQSYHHGNLRETLLAEALKQLDENGADAIGIRQIAKSVGVAHSAPTNHFKNKQALLTALHQKSVQHFIEIVKDRLDSQALTEEPIKQFASIVLEYGLQYPYRYRLIWQSEYRLEEAMDEVYELLTSMLQVYAVQKKVDVETQAIAVWSLIHGYVVLRLDKHLQAGTDSVNGLNRQLAIIDVIIKGIK